MNPVPPNIRFSDGGGQHRADPVDELHGPSLALDTDTRDARRSGSALTRTLSATPAAPRIRCRRPSRGCLMGADPPTEEFR